MEVGGEGSTLGGKEERKKSSTLLEIERNRSLFMEQQGQHMPLALTRLACMTEGGVSLDLALLP